MRVEGAGRYQEMMECLFDCHLLQEYVPSKVLVDILCLITRSRAPFLHIAPKALNLLSSNGLVVRVNEIFLVVDRKMCEATFT